MRFLIDAHYLGRRETGNETWMRNVIASLEPLAGDDHLVYAVTDEGRDELRALTDGAAHPVSGRSARRLTVELPGLIRRLRPDAVLSTYASPITRRPCVLFVHDVSLEDRRVRDWLPPAMRLSHRWAVRASSRRAARVLVPSDHCRTDVVEKLGVPPARVMVAPGAPDRRLLTLLECTPTTPRGDDFVILSVGSVVPRKNLLRLAQAVRSRLDAGDPVRWRIVGPVPRDGKATASAIRALLGASVEITGYVGHARLVAEYRAADVLCFPSLFEGFGLPAAEAMAAGIPVVVSDATSLPEVVGDAALRLDPYDAPAWADAIRRLFRDQALRDSLARAGRVRAGQLSWDRTAAITLRALRAAGGAGATAPLLEQHRDVQPVGR